MAWLASISWATLVPLVVAVVTALATAVLTWVTWVLAKETKRLADATSAPHVVVTLQPSAWSIMHTELIIQNAGTGTAYDIEVSFNPPLQVERRGQPMPMPVRSLSVLKPGQSFPVFLNGFEKLDQQTIEISTSWKRRPTDEVRESYNYTLDLRSDYDNWGQLGGPPPEIQTVKELGKISKSLEDLSTGFRRLKVDVFNRLDRKAENEELEERWRRQSGDEG